MSEQDELSVKFHGTKEEQAASGHYGMVCEAPANLRPVVFINAKGQLVDASGRLLTPQEH
jgi:hypothetical protein